MNDQTLIEALRELRAAQQHHEALQQRQTDLLREIKTLQDDSDASSRRLNDALMTVAALLKTTEDPELAGAPS